jgi:hypothetical protein
MTADRAVPLVAVAVLTGCLVSIAAPAAAQGRFELAGGVRWTGTMAFDEVDANENTAGGGTRKLFATATSLRPATGADARMAVRLISGLRAEGAFVFAATDLATRVTGDTEGAADVTVTDRIQEYSFEGGIRGELARWRVGRLSPFATAGGAYVRHAHDGRRIVDAGHLWYVGAGFTYPISRRVGLRSDVRADFLSGGAALDENTHTAPSIGASVFWRF